MLVLEDFALELQCDQGIQISAWANEKTPHWSLSLLREPIHFSMSQKGLRRGQAETI
jgi:hypothetical protein